MKKLTTLAAFMLLTLTATAQSIKGTWKITGELANALQESAGSDDRQMSMGFEFGDITVKALVWATVAEDGLQMDMVVSEPGIYTRSGNEVTCTFDPKNLDFDITNLKTDDEEMNSMLADPTSRQLVLSLVKEEAKRGMGDSTSEITELFNQFRNFTIISQTKTKMVINIHDIEVTLVRK